MTWDKNRAKQEIVNKEKPIMMGQQKAGQQHNSIDMC